MTTRQTRSVGDGSLLRRYEYDDGWVVAADVGVDDESISVDTVGDTAIVVIERDGEPAESEFELPGEARSASVTNGVLTIEGDR
ncbi:Hsp20/alpha crystallin family protein [Halorubrum aethiopicum]|jgi:HSP20 family molecular chaperone IbpA|uniref:Hsp20/alpha crystallin family protein n=1 Tax=Halorubrum aethiopicum TaxID=1758255 RepID=UPI00082B019D|nr:Hsp20/alpha crystallin family protein [Halorubrum aethiopicum]